MLKSLHRVWDRILLAWALHAVRRCRAVDFEKGIRLLSSGRVGPLLYAERRRKESMSTSRMLRDQLRQAHQFLDSAVDGRLADQSQWQPAGMANPLGATYAHVLFGEDAFVAMLGGTPALFADGWVGRTGVIPVPPLSPPGSFDAYRSELARIGAAGARRPAGAASLRTGSAAVPDDYLASLSDHDLDQQVDLSAAGFGIQPLVWLLSSGLVAHVLSHWGEIVCLKGLQGERGFPV